MKSVCVYCGSNTGATSAYPEAAAALGRAIAARGMRLVYGGTTSGNMKVLADATLAAGGKVLGIITASLRERGKQHHGLSEIEVVDDLLQRKARMIERSDAFIALPGGIGTLDELFATWSAGQLGEHLKPCGLLDVNGYFAKLSDFLDHMVAERFLKDQHRAMLAIAPDADTLLDRLAAYQAPSLDKWFAPSPAG